MHLPSHPELVVYRFKGVFSKDSSRKIEVRVNMDKDGKVAGFWVKPWSDSVL